MLYGYMENEKINRQINPLSFLLSCMLLVTSACSLYPIEATENIAHFNVESPSINDIAPNFVLKNVGGKSVELNSLIGDDKPIVLQMGSYTCPVFRYRRWGMANLYERYNEKVNFLLVYTIEAPPKGSESPYFGEEYRTWWNILTGADVTQALNFEERFSQAYTTVKSLNVSYQVVVDTMENKVWKSYGRAPSAAFVIDRKGKVVLKQPWVYPDGIARMLESLLQTNDE